MCYPTRPIDAGRREGKAIVTPSNQTPSMTTRLTRTGRMPSCPPIGLTLASTAGRRWIAVSLLCGVASASPCIVAAQSSIVTPVVPSPAAHCLDTASAVLPARLDDRHLIYVEQETVVANRDGRVLVAGAPVFVWRHAGERYDLLGQDSLFGMIVEPSSALVHAIPSPLPGHLLKGMRAAPLPDGWWLVAFAEVHSVQSQTPPNVIAMWAGETDGSSWRALQKLPDVSDTLDVLRLSELAVHDGRVRLAAPVRRDWRRRVVLFSRDEGRWTVRADDVGLSEYAAIATTASLDLLAVIRPDTTAGKEDHNSLFLYSKAPNDTLWSPHPRLWRGGKTKSAYEPRIVSGAGQPVLLWLTGPMFHATSAWALSLAMIPDSAVTPIPLPTVASTMSASALGNAGVIVTFDRASPTKDLRLFEYGEPLRANLILGKQTEYRGLMGIALTPDRVVLVASKAAEPPRDPAVVSIIETHAWRCP
jgi:hypothetical protein